MVWTDKNFRADWARSCDLPQDTGLNEGGDALTLTNRATRSLKVINSLKSLIEVEVDN